MRSGLVKTSATLAIAWWLSLLAQAAPAAAWVCLTANGRCVKWQANSAHLSFFLGTAGGQLSNGTFTFDDNAIFAAGDWNAIGSPFQFSYQVGGAFNNPCGGQGPRHACNDTGPIADNPVFFTGDVCGRGFGDILAQTTNCYDPSAAAMVNAPVFVNLNESWDAYDGPLNPRYTDIRRVMSHELGHVLGLIHPDNQGALMYQYVSDVDRPRSDDINGLNAMYGSSAPAPTNDTGGCAVTGARGGGYPAAIAALLIWLVARRRSSQSKAAKTS